MKFFKHILLFAVFSFTLYASSIESNGGLIEISREYEINNNSANYDTEFELKFEFN